MLLLRCDIIPFFTCVGYLGHPFTNSPMASTGSVRTENTEAYQGCDSHLITLILMMRLLVSMSARLPIAQGKLAVALQVRSVLPSGGADEESCVIHQTRNKNVPLIETFQSRTWDTIVV